MLKSLKFSTEFLKIIRDFKLDQDRSDSLPQEIKEHLANQHLNQMIAEHDLEPEMLVWGLVHMIEILLKFGDMTPEDLTDVMEKFINYILDAKIGAQLSNFNQYPTPNAASKPFINPDDLKNTAIYPSAEQMKTLEFVKDLGSKTAMHG